MEPEIPNLLRLCQWFTAFQTNPPKQRNIIKHRKQYFSQQKAQLETKIESKIREGIIIPIIAVKPFRIKRKKRKKKK